MNISKENFDRAAKLTVLDATQVETFWQELLLHADPPDKGTPGAHNNGSRFDLAHLAYYFGAVIVLGAMGWFMTGAWEVFGGPGISLIAAAYASVFAVAGWKLWSRPQSNLRTPGGLLVTLAVGMTPLMVYGLERWFHWWPQDDPGNYENFHPYVNGSWIVMELGTILAGILALRFVRFPFLTLPVAFALWFLSMDLVPFLFHRPDYTWDERRWVSIYFGLAMLIGALIVDTVRRWRGPDYGFWLSLFGLLAFWGGLTSLDSSNEWSRFAYVLINVVLMLAGVIFDRRACVVFGAIGVNYYVGDLAHRVFADSLLFPFALSLLGLLVIAGGVLYQRKSEQWRALILANCPALWREYLPSRHRSA